MTEREARKLAKEAVSGEYAVIDEIWNRRRVNYHSVAADYDRDTIKDLAPFRIGAVSGITAPLFYARPGSIICPRFTFSCLGTIPIHIWATLPFV